METLAGQLGIAIVGGTISMFLAAVVNLITRGGVVRLLGGMSREQLKDVKLLLQHAIIVTDQEPDVFSPNWVRFERIKGQFPLASGSYEDYRSESRRFALGDSGGRYKHTLTPAEVAGDPVKAHTNMPPYLVLNFLKRRYESR